MHGNPSLFSTRHSQARSPRGVAGSSLGSSAQSPEFPLPACLPRDGPVQRCCYFFSRPTLTAPRCYRGAVRRPVCTEAPCKIESSFYCATPAASGRKRPPAPGSAHQSRPTNFCRLVATNADFPSTLERLKAKYARIETPKRSSLSASRAAISFERISVSLFSRLIVAIADEPDIRAFESHPAVSYGSALPSPVSGCRVRNRPPSAACATCATTSDAK